MPFRKSQVAPVMLHLPMAGQIGSFCGAAPMVVQATLVMLQLPGMLAQGTFELQAECVLAHVPLFEQSLFVEHGTDGSLAHVPMVLGHWLSAVHAALLVLQVPSVWHWAWPVQGFCDQGWPPALEQVPGVAEHCAADVQALPPKAQVPPRSGQVLLAKHDAAAWQMPLPMPAQLEFWLHGVTPSGHKR